MLLIIKKRIILKCHRYDENDNMILTYFRNIKFIY